MRVWGVMGLMLLASLPAAAQQQGGGLPADVLGALDMAPVRQGGAERAEEERPPSFEELQLRASVRRALQPTPAGRVANRLDETWVMGPVDPEKKKRFERGRYQFPLLPPLDMGPLGVGVNTSIKQPAVKLRYRMKPEKKGGR